MWNQTPLPMPYSTSMPSDILSQRKHFYEENETEISKKPRLKQKVKRRISNKASKQNGSTTTLKTTTETIAENCQNCVNDGENESEKENNTNLDKKLSQASTPELLTSIGSSIGRQLEKSASLVDSEVRKDMHRFDKCITCSTCAENSCSLNNHYVRQRRETIPSLTALDAPINESILNPLDNLTSQVELQKYLSNQHSLSTRFMTSPVGYDVFLSCSSSSELEWITQKAVPQLQ